MFHFKEQGPGPMLRGTTGKGSWWSQPAGKAPRRRSQLECDFDFSPHFTLSCQIGFRSDDISFSRRCAKTWNGSEMRQLLPYMPGGVGDIITFAALLWLNNTANSNYSNKTQAANHANVALSNRPAYPPPPPPPPPSPLFPTSASLCASLSPGECCDPFISDLSACWPYLCSHVDAQPSSSLT